MKNIVYINKDDNYFELKKMAQKYGISRMTLWRARKRGYFCVDYRKREINIADDIVDNNVIESWYDLAWKVYFRMFKDYIEEREDLVQEAVIRLWELSGKEGINSFRYKWGICVNAMRNWLNNSFSRKLSSEKAEDNNYIFDIECVDRSYLNFEIWEAIGKNCSKEDIREIQLFVNGYKNTLSERVKIKLLELLTSN